MSLTIVPNEGHVIQSLTGAELYDVLDGYGADGQFPLERVFSEKNWPNLQST